MATELVYDVRLKYRCVNCGAEWVEEETRDWMPEVQWIGWVGGHTKCWMHRCGEREVGPIEMVSGEWDEAREREV